MYILKLPNLIKCIQIIFLKMKLYKHFNIPVLYILLLNQTDPFFLLDFTREVKL